MSERIRKKTRISWVDPKSNNSYRLSSHYKIRTEKTGHYFTNGSLTENTKYVWICLHGYGQLAKYFIQKFDFLNPVEHFVIVPEGLNRFYYGDSNDRPIANWMTKEDRLDEIADYVTFLELLRKKIGWDKNPAVKVIYLGFSQGVNTLIRWMANAHQRCDQLLLWAGSLPEDMLLEQHQSYFEKISSSYFIGKADPYFNEQQGIDMEQLAARAGIHAKVQWFEGDHKVDETTLRIWIEKQKLT